MADIYEFRILKEEAEIVVRDCVVRVLDGKAYNSSKVCGCVRACVAVDGARGSLPPCWLRRPVSWW
jgi:hypothetical protein